MQNNKVLHLPKTETEMSEYEANGAKRSPGKKSSNGEDSNME
jgi:hypothetical protein